jgi:hypothetical protein
MSRFSKRKMLKSSKRAVSDREKEQIAVEEQVHKDIQCLKDNNLIRTDMDIIVYTVLI